MSFRLGDFRPQIDPKVLTREPGTRFDGRGPDELRPVRLTTGFLKHAEGSCLVEVGDTRPKRPKWPSRPRTAQTGS